MEKLSKVNRVVEVEESNVSEFAASYALPATLELKNLQYLTAKTSDGGNMMPSSLRGLVGNLPFQFSGEVADELYEAINEAAAEWFGISGIKTDGKVTGSESLALTLLLEIVPDAVAHEAKDRQENPLGYYHMHKGHVTGVFGLRYRKVRFGKAPEMTEMWAGRE